jgi:hypothetical protein
MNGRHFSAMVIAASVGVLGSRSAWATTWVVGATQVSSTSFYSGVEITFTVPATPANAGTSLKSSIWPGLEPQDGTLVLQPVLEYNEGGAGGWTMHNEVAGQGCGNICYRDTGVTVQPGDSIYASVMMDFGNPGCAVNAGTTGANCNYLILWWDETSGATATTPDLAVPKPLTVALGLIFEPIGTATSCNDFPLGVITSQANVYEYQGPSDLGVPVTNLTAGTPSSGPPFSNISAGSGAAYPNCVNIATSRSQPPPSGYDQISMWLN